ncbi:E3 ubiquitin-protein ligase MPSR1-like [Argentina anserina]|uniref:E3 ubiquitin-protein ligase MPSR1-like n=1 Tax=Argentina anserina TaxID=57926 RepID=UPI002176477C|nr:E3 ubiquitin-protein ligase MPSR1-like [Potentilla anserina]
MASDDALSQFAAFFDRLSRDRDLPPIIPFIMGLAVAGSTPPTATTATDSDQQPPSADRRSNRVDRLVVLDGGNQNMVVIQSGSAGIGSLMRQLAKEGHPPASKASIAAMPTVAVAESGRECPICLDIFDVGGEAKQMPCNHLFHGNCVEKWLQAHGTCPVCRYTMPADEEEEPEKNEENGISVSIFIRATTEEEPDQTQDDDDDDDEDGGDESTPSQEAAADDHMQS